MCGQTQMCHASEDLKGEARGRQGAISQSARQRAAGFGITFKGCLPSSPRVPEQLRTHFAQSSSLLNVLWQHLVEQRKNCTAPWRATLLLLISSLPKALRPHRFRTPPPGCRQACTQSISTAFISTLPGRKHALLYRQDLSRWDKEIYCNCSLTGGFSLGCAQKAASMILAAIKQAFTERFWVIMVP